MGITRKVLEKTSHNADEGARLAYFAFPPPHGVLGVPRADLVDVDETGVWLMCCRRRYGMVESGKNAATHAPYPEGKKFSVILAISIAGVVGCFISDLPGTSNETFFHFAAALLDALEDRPRVILLDNLSSHKWAPTKQIIRVAGHEIVYRPTYSSDLGSIEFANNVFKMWLKRHMDEITEENLPIYAEAAICQLTAEQCRGFFVHTGHFV